MKYYETIPLTKLESESGTLTYASSDDIKEGAFVQVPLRNNLKTALVLREVTKPTFAAREIKRVLLPDTSLPAPLIRLADFIKENYFCSLGEAISTIIPTDITKSRRATTSARDNQAEVEEKLTLTSAQKTVYKAIENDTDTLPHLIHGVTGSGKTEIYLQLVEQAITAGKSAIILIPEISLTPQTSARFLARFGSKVAVTHSALKETERYQIWKQALDGEVRVIIGPRSALFSPFQDLGLIIIDEAHDGSYKQDQTPRYNTIAVAEKLASLTGARLVLGTATPLVENYYAALTGKYHLHHLHDRIHGEAMPEVEIIDMRHEFKLGNKSIISEKLQTEIQTSLRNHKQILLFLNRRGMSTFVSCRECGHVESCPECEVPLVFHYSEMNLECHHCGFKKAAPVKCPDCHSLAIKYFGSGTEKIELEIKKLFGDQVRISRMDRDTTSKRGSHADIFEDIRSGATDVIIGTQMIAKGWDIAGIGLIGVISADAMINLPDYMAGERAFSTLLQVAGRTGRGVESGKVLIQTYNPDAEIFSPLVRHSYEDFYKREIAEREDLGYPPFVKLVKLLYNTSDPEKAKAGSETVARSLAGAFATHKIEASYLGPSPAFIPKLNGKYRYQFVIKLKLIDQISLSKAYKIISETTPREWSVDADPYGLI